jgi:hypothetical protein
MTVFLLDKMTSPYNRRIIINKKKESSLNPIEIGFTIILAFFIGQRPITEAFGDTMVYSYDMEFYRSLTFNFDFLAENLLFDNLFHYMAYIGSSYNTFLTLISFIYFFGIYFSCRKIFKENTFIAFFVYLGGLSTWSYSINGFKNGAAASLMLLAIAYHEKKLLSVLFVFLAWGFHHSMILPVGAYIAMKIVKNPKYYFIFWFFALIMSALHITFFQTLFAGFSDETGSKYLSESGGSYRTGFRLDFILYSAVPVFFGYRMLYKLKTADEFYQVLMTLFLFTNGIWMLCMYANYTNRIAYLSWFMYPIVLIYPFVNLKYSPKQLIEAKYIIMGHLAITIFFQYLRQAI